MKEATESLATLRGFDFRCLSLKSILKIAEEDFPQTEDEKQPFDPSRRMVDSYLALELMLNLKWNDPVR